MNFIKRLFSSNDTNSIERQAGFVEGDIFYTHFDNKFHLYKLLVSDQEFDCYHVLTYDPLNNLPGTLDIEKLKVFVYHSPFDKTAFANAVLLTNNVIKSADLIGYHEYLRRTQDTNYYVTIANSYYKTGFRLTDEKKYLEAIDSYSKAIDLFPQFFEALDNRAFCKMDLGLWKDAIEDFKLSIEQNPSSFLAEFSIGECYYKMGDYQNAKRQFENASKIDPNHKAPRQFLDKLNELIGG